MKQADEQLMHNQANVSKEVENALKILLHIKKILQSIYQDVPSMTQVKEKTEDLLISIDVEKQKLYEERIKRKERRKKKPANHKATLKTATRRKKDDSQRQLSSVQAETNHKEAQQT